MMTHDIPPSSEGMFIEDSQPPPPPSLLDLIVKECKELGFSPTLERWTAHCELSLKDFQTGGSQRLEDDRRLFTEAWGCVIALAGQLWREAEEHDEDPEEHADEDAADDPGSDSSSG